MPRTFNLALRVGPILLVVLLSLAWAIMATAADRFIVVQSTTSTRNSGLLDYLLPQFESATGIAVRVVAVGTGQALKNARNGDGDVLLVHAKRAEEKFVAEGFGVTRYDLMYNDFVIVGPIDDPARIDGGHDADKALAAVASSNAPFASRGDDSGTHKKELALWVDAKVDVGAARGWYRETGSGMGATLNVAVGMNAYALTDRATWIAFGNKGELGIRVEGDPKLFNQYGIIAVDAKRHPHVKADDAKRFVDWMLGAQAQKAIGEFRLDGKQLFYPNASP